MEAVRGSPHPKFWALMMRGFTLVELMAVIVIIALATAIVAVNADYITPSAALRSEARRIAARFLLARLYAVSNAKTYTVVYEFNEDEALVWTLMPQEEDEEGRLIEDERQIVGGVADRLHDSVQMLAVVLPDETTYEEGHVEIDVSPYGDVGSHIVVLARRDRPDEKIWIKMDALTGLVTYHNEEVSFWPVQEEEEEPQGGTQ